MIASMRVYARASFDFGCVALYRVRPIALRRKQARFYRQIFSPWRAMMITCLPLFADMYGKKWQSRQDAAIFKLGR
jgi:hypothetical protein